MIKESIIKVGNVMERYAAENYLGMLREIYIALAASLLLFIGL